MEITGITAGGEEIRLNAASVNLNREYGVPADDMEVIIPWEGEFPELARLCAELDGEPVFTGIVDVTERNDSSAGRYVRIEARSLAGLLLDNEARPSVYGGVSVGLIFENHIRPYGIKNYHGRDIMLEGKFTVSKGMSEWQAVLDFCRQCYGTFPYVAADSTVYLEPPESGEEINFEAYSALTERRSRCKLLSGVYIKTAASKDYESFIESETAKGAGVTAVRYLDASQSGSLPMSTAEDMLRLGEEDYYTLELTFPDCRLPLTGAAARVGKLTGLFVSRVRYSRTQSGEKTVVQLKVRNS